MTKLSLRIETAKNTKLTKSALIRGKKQSKTLTVKNKNPNFQNFLSPLLKMSYGQRPTKSG